METLVIDVLCGVTEREGPRMTLRVLVDVGTFPEMGEQQILSQDHLCFSSFILFK